MIETAGRERLIKWLNVSGRTQDLLAAALGVTQGVVSRWCSGVARPKAFLRPAIAAVTGIGEELWLTAEERRHVRRALVSARRASSVRGRTGT